jgi:ectoine hydroxylase-related dioxygenase (phytanoyl-CoA dioxygenase family)
MQEEYQQYGYLVQRNFFPAQTLDHIEPVVRRFHKQWMAANKQYYDTGSINSAYLSHRDAMSKEDRAALFSFIACGALAALARALIPTGPAFLNTQLFFDPRDPQQKNYWHRDIQYSPHTAAEQEARLATTIALHFRVPLADERGIELVPGSHVRWDNDEEFDTRMGRNSRTPSGTLTRGLAIPLRREDLLVFSGNMIHRGLYGGNRFALDIMFTDTDPEVLQHAHAACLPDEEAARSLVNGDLFERTRKALTKNGP